MPIRRHRPWDLPPREASPESVFLDRRAWLRAAGLLGLAAIANPVSEASGRADEDTTNAAVPSAVARIYPARRDARYPIDRSLSPEHVVASYNNYCEFGDAKDDPARAAQKLTTRPWTLDIGGLVEKPITIDRDELVRRMRPHVEERVYRHRCVERWSIAVPWTGFPVRRLVEFAKPLAGARYLRTVSFRRPSEALDQRKPWYPFPYFEGFRLEEAVNDLAFVVIGSYGHELPKQNGSPLSIRMPWKYGYKSPKGIVKLELTDREPPTFWHSLAPVEYGFLSNVNPSVSHPRWSQTEEKFFGAKGVEIRETLPYNGYGEWVGDMYDEESRRTRS